MRFRPSASCRCGLGSIRHLLTGAVLVGLCMAAAAQTASSASAPSDKPGVLQTVGGAIERGVRAAASGVERGVQAAASGVERGASAAARAVERGASAAAGGVERGASATRGALGLPPAASAAGSAPKAPPTHGR